MATTATTAVKLPDGATVILADGTENHILGGGAAVSENGRASVTVYIYGMYAAGALTIEGEKDGIGTFFVSSGEHKYRRCSDLFHCALCRRRSYGKGRCGDKQER